MIKKWCKILFNILYTLYVWSHHGVISSKSFYFRFRISITKGSLIRVIGSKIYNTWILVNGINNEIIFTKAFIENCQISIIGKNNKIIIKNGVKLRRAIINLRGSNCNIIIGEKTTFGQVRIVNVGKNNDITIGEGCLFADNIEIWASDTHSIYDKGGNFINPEKPINIGDKVWIGSYVKILKGVTIGSNAIVGMNSLVTKNIENGTLCAGNPLRVIKNDVSWSLDYQIE
ncbi:MAG: acyltransferase [Paludibacter sp.]|nr:acyltransferase [Paludibacter sp.]